MKIIETKELKKHFGGLYAVNGFSVAFDKGQTIGIIGPNGSGKTTFIDLLSGIIEIDSGEIIVDGTDKMTKVLPHKLSSYGITRTFQNVQLFEQMTVLDNILVVVTERNVLNSIFERKVEHQHRAAEDVLRKVGLWEKHNQLAVNLSYGQRKLLETARVLAMNVEVYLFDEPFAGLFPEMKQYVSSIIQELKRQNKTVVLIEHDIGLIRKLCDYIFVMDGGNLLAEGKPDLVLKRKDVIEAYLGK